METIKAIFQKPDPQAQMRKCTALIRTSVRKVDRDIATLRQLETRTKNLIVNASKRGQREPARAAQAQKDAVRFARQLVRVRRQVNRLHTSKAQLASIQMQVQETFAVQKIQGSIKAGTSVLREMNQLSRVPALAGNMQELGVELMKAGVVEEMVGDMMPGGEDELDDELGEEADAEVEKVLGEILKGKMDGVGRVPEGKVDHVIAVGGQQEDAIGNLDEGEALDDEAELARLRQRLDALSS